MKLLSVVIPCYNSRDYMEHCINSCLVGGEDLEIFIVDDGSSDDTAKIAKAYEDKYPSICKAIIKENGGHGSGINVGLSMATGLFFKVVDSDDWLDGKSLLEVLDRLRQCVRAGEESRLDMLITNFIYDKQGAFRKHRMHYNSTFPKDRIVGWKDVMRIHMGTYILMHSVIYRTEVLRECGLKLPEHCFYVDNLYVYVPLPYVKQFMYMDQDLYHYFIGRDDQSVNEERMIKNIDQQIKVNKLLLDAYDLDTIDNENLRKYMYNYGEILTTVSTVLLLRSGTKENLRKKKELWRYLKREHPKFYHTMRKRFLGIVTNIPGRVGRWFAVRGYKLAKKVVGFS